MPAHLRQHLGRLGEDLALAHLERLGHTLVARNYRTRYGEIDLVVFDSRTLVFVEVKTRRANSAARGPWEALHERKREQVRRMAAAFLLEVANRPHSADLRFDAIGVAYRRPRAPGPPRPPGGGVLMSGAVSYRASCW